jgi:hypothetical protein
MSREGQVVAESVGLGDTWAVYYLSGLLAVHGPLGAISFPIIRTPFDELTASAPFQKRDSTTYIPSYKFKV